MPTNPGAYFLKYCHLACACMGGRADLVAVLRRGLVHLARAARREGHRSDEQDADDGGTQSPVHSGRPPG